MRRWDGAEGSQMRVAIVGLIGAGLAVLLWIAFVGIEGPGPEPLEEPDTEERVEDVASGAGLEGRAVAATGPIRPEESAGTGIVRAQVVDEMGEPMGGVDVELRIVKQHDHFEWRPSKHASDQYRPPVDAKLIETAPTQDDGWIEFRGLDVRRSYEVRAKPKAPYYGAQARVSPGNSTMPPVLMLGKGVPLRVRIVDGTGEGLKGYVQGTVARMADHRRWNQSGGWQMPFTVTGGDGRLTIPSVPENPLTLSIKVPGIGSRYGIDVRPPFDTEVLLQITHAGGPAITGTVTDSTGAAVQGARLIATVNPRGPNTWHQRYIHVVETGADGRYRMQGLPSGFLTSLPVHKSGYIYVQNAAPQMELEGGQEVEVDVTLYRGGVLEGTIRDTEGNALPGARVIASPPGNNYWNNRGTTALADGAGRYRIEDVPLGKGQVGAYADGYYMPSPKGVKVRSWQAPPGVLYEVKAEGESLVRDVELLKGVRVAGRVVTKAKEPVAGARIWAWGNLQQRVQAFDQKALQRVTDADGRFEYAGLPPGGVWSFNAHSSEGNAKPVKVTLAEGKEPEPIELIFNPLGGIRGVIDMGSRRVTRQRGVRIRGKQGGGTHTAVTRADGAFEQRGLVAGTYEVYATDGLGRRAGPSATVEVADGAWVEDVKIAIEAMEDIRGIVIDLDGEPVPNLSVRLYYKSGTATRWSNNSTNTRPDGRFAWTDLLPGEYEIKIGNEKDRARVNPGDKEQKFTYIVPPKDIVTGLVIGPEGRPVPGGYVSVRRLRGRNNWNGSTAQIINGRFRGEAPAGDGQINLSVDNALDAFGRKLNVLPQVYEDYNPASGPVEIKLEAGQKIAGQVVDPSGKPVPYMGVHIQKERRDGRKWYGYYNTGYNTHIRTDEEGRFEKLGLADDRYEVYVQTGGAWLPPEPVSTDAGNTNVVIRLSKGAVIQGQVTAEGSESVSGANVSFTWSVKDERGRNRNSYRNATTGAEGKFELTGLPLDAVGTLNINPPSGNKSGYIATSMRDIGAGQSGLSVVLEKGGFIEGTVRGPMGETVGRIRIRAYRHDGNRWVRKHSVRAGNDGTFKIGPVSAELYQLRISAYGEYTAPPPIDVRAPVSDLVLEVPKGHAVRGKVLGENVRRFQAVWYYRDANGNVKSKSGSVSSNGSFFINQPSEDLGTLVVRRHGDNRFAVLEDVRAMDGPFEIQLQEGISISGYVTDLPERFRWGNVWARDANNRYASGNLSRDGTFVIRGLAPGTYNVGGNIRPGKLQLLKDVEAGSENVVIQWTER